MRRNSPSSIQQVKEKEKNGPSPQHATQAHRRTPKGRPSLLGNISLKRWFLHGELLEEQDATTLTVHKI